MGQGSSKSKKLNQLEEITKVLESNLEALKSNSNVLLPILKALDSSSEIISLVKPIQKIQKDISTIITAIKESGFIKSEDAIDKDSSQTKKLDPLKDKIKKTKDNPLEKTKDNPLEKKIKALKSNLNALVSNLKALDSSAKFVMRSPIPNLAVSPIPDIQEAILKVINDITEREIVKSEPEYTNRDGSKANIRADGFKKSDALEFFRGDK